MAVDFSSYLSKPVGEIEAPKALPPGHYYATVAGYEPKESTTGKPMLAVSLALQSAGEDVDQSLLPANGIQGRKLMTNFMLDQEFGMFGIKEMIAAAGIEMDAAQGIGVYLEQIKNRPVMLLVANRLMDKNDPSSRTVEDIKKILAPA